RQLENLGALLTALALLFVPILLLRHHLFVWMDIPPGVDPSLDTKRAYLNWPFFLVRAVIFLGFFLLAALALRRLSAEQDKDGNPRFTISMRKVAFVSLPMFALCLTFGANIGRLTKRSEEHTSELQSRGHLVCRLLLEKK